MLGFHVKFERVYLFQDENGHFGRLKYNIVLFIIDEC